VSNEPDINVRDMRRRFDRAAERFDTADFVHAVTREGLIARLEPLVVNASTILDLGSATGAAYPLLKRRFGRAHIVSLDLSHAMLQQNLGKRRWFSGRPCVQASADSLPLADHSVDVVFANQLLPWIDDAAPVFGEVSRTLRKGGVFAFATLGPDSLSELGNAWSAVDARPHVRRFPDMHDIGDALVRAGLSDPVLDIDRLTVRYDDADKLFTDLTRIGARNSLSGRHRGLAGKGRLSEMLAALGIGPDGPGASFDLELVYGHCWGGGARKDPTQYRIDAASIPRRQR